MTHLKQNHRFVIFSKWKPVFFRRENYNDRRPHNVGFALFVDFRDTTSHLTFQLQAQNSLITYFNKHGIFQLAKTWKTVYLFEVRDYIARLHSVQVTQKIFHVDFCLFRYNTFTSWRKLGRSSGRPSKMNLGFTPVASTLLTLWALRAFYAQ